MKTFVKELFWTFSHEIGKANEAFSLAYRLTFKDKL